MRFLGFLLGIGALGALLLASQLYWVRRLRDWGRRLIPNALAGRWLGGLAVALYLLMCAAFAYSLVGLRRLPEPTHLTLRAALTEAPFPIWFVCSFVGFTLAALFSVADRLARGVHAIYSRLTHTSNPGRPPLLSLGRRQFLEQTALAVTAAPFVAGAYGLFYGRLNLEVTHQRITLPRLPKAFDGFRIVQLSDIHIGPFMTSAEVRKYVAIANSQKSDLVALTGDFITWDPSTQEAAVQTLAGLKAPFGVVGCLGNHELWTGTEDSITRMFAVLGVPILRQTCAPIRLHGETLNVIGVDFQTRTHMARNGEGVVRRYLEGIEPLVMPDTANILLSHNPNTFDRAAELGIDLSLAGHTHGGQLTLEFISPALSPSRLITPYVRGHFQKPGGQLYVNRGIGTILVPVRFGAPPEITVYELVKA
ncbi:MAG: metallophosphoesterase [Acidobacteriia bacterium]|nr:metallophosphoesterase [Terriglobia bacterium]